MALEEYKKDFIELALEADALKFGEYTLKSGRVSPHFFKADSFHSGNFLNKIGAAYAQTIHKNVGKANIVFGPAYKGIPLATATVIGLSNVKKDNRKKGYEASFSCNRKEVKDHGDGGDFMGVKPCGETIIVDDVITSGTSINESIDFIKKHGGEITAAIVMVDRQERGLTSELSAIQEVEQNHGIKVYSIITLEDILEYTKNNPKLAEYTPQIIAYREQYGVK